MTGAPLSSPVRDAFLTLTGSLLVVRLGLLLPYMSLAAMQSVAPVDHRFFPMLLREPTLLVVAFIVPLVTDLIVFLGVRHRRESTASLRRDMKRVAVCEAAGSAVLLVHQATYFTATWVVFFWAGLFLVWMAWSGAESLERAKANGPFLAQLIVGFFFLGGAVGKWTSGYWSGEVFEELFFGSSRSFFPLVRGWLGDADAHVAALWFSRWVVVVETLMAVVVLAPSQLAFVASLVAVAGLWLTSSDLFEVCLPIIGIAIAGRALARSG